MKHTKQFIAAITGATLVMGSALIAADSADKKNPKDIHDVMEWAHKGRTSTAANVRDGKGSDADVETLLGYYKFLATQKPPQGDEASWKEKTAALVAATEKLKKKEAGAQEAFKTAVNCKACHDIHKPAE